MCNPERSCAQAFGVHGLGCSGADWVLQVSVSGFLAAVLGVGTAGQCNDVVARMQAHGVGLIRVEVEFQPIVGRHAHEDIAKG